MAPYSPAQSAAAAQSAPFQAASAMNAAYLTQGESASLASRILPASTLFPDATASPNFITFERLREIPEPEMRDIVFAQEPDPRKRVEKWKERRMGAVARDALKTQYYILYMLCYDGKAHLYSVDADRCEVKPIPGSRTLESTLRFQFNRYRSLVEERASTLNIDGVNLYCYPRTASLDDISAARMNTKVIQMIFNNPAVKREKMKHCILLPLLGTTYSYTYWDEYAYSYVKTPDGDVICGQFGDACLEIIPPYKMRFPMGIRTLEEAPWIIYEDLKSFDWMRQRYPEAARHLDPRDRDPDLYYNGIYSVFQANAGLDARLADLSMGRFYGRSGLNYPAIGNGGISGNQYVRDALPYLLTHCFERAQHPEYGPYINYTLYCRGVELENRPLAPYVRDPDTDEIFLRTHADGKPKFWDMPFTQCRYLELPDVFEGRSMTSDALDPLRILCIIDSMGVKNIVDMSMTFMMHHSSDSVHPIYSRIFTILKYTREAPTFERPRTQLQDMVFAARYWESQLYSVIGRPESIQGELPAAATSGKALEELNSRAEAKSRNIRERNNSFWEATLTKFIEQYRWNADESRILYGPGQQDIHGSIAFKKQDLLGGSDIKVQFEGAVNWSWQERYEFAMSKVQAGLMDLEDAEDFITESGSREKIDRRSLADNLARYFIDRILAMKDEEADAGYLFVQNFIAAALEAVRLASAGKPIDPNLFDAEGRRARNDALRELGIGVMPFHWSERQARVTEFYLNSTEALSLPNGKLGLITERWTALADKNSALQRLTFAGGAGAMGQGSLTGAPAQAGAPAKAAIKPPMKSLSPRQPGSLAESGKKAG